MLHVANRVRRVKLPGLGRSLSARLLWLTVGLVLFAEVMVFVPSLGRERRDWLTEHLRDANTTAFAITAVHGPPPSGAELERLLGMSADESIEVRRAGRTLLALGPSAAVAPAARIDLRSESALTGIWRAIEVLFGRGDRLVELSGAGVLRPGASLAVVFHERALTRELRSFAGEIAATSLLIAASAGVVVYLALLILLVRPMRRLTDSIAAFRADPEHGAPLDPRAVSWLADDEMAVAGRELAAMQHELRAALWRNARLAALGTVVAKIGHDLRNILSPAALAAERLAGHADAQVARSGETVIQAIERAIQLVRQSLEFAREGPPTLDRARFWLGDLVQEAIDSVVSGMPEFAARNDVAPRLSVEADRTQLLRILLNLLRNAAEAGARSARIGAAETAEGVEIRIEDDGPGLPELVRAGLFRPFVGGGRRGGSGLGLAIARDLMRAHGGDIELGSTGAAGTVFRLLLPTQQNPAAAADPEGGTQVAGS